MSNEYVGFRDAIHVPYIVLLCEQDLAPGDKCSMRSNHLCVKWPTGELMDEGGAEPEWHGVADPFSEAVIPAGHPFRLHIKKSCFRGLRHDFQIDAGGAGGTPNCHMTCDVE